MADLAQRMAGTAAQYKIAHPCFIINWDQTAVMLMNASRYTYHAVKDKQVPVVGQEEKQADHSRGGQHPRWRPAASAADIQGSRPGQEAAEGRAQPALGGDGQHQRLAPHADGQPLEHAGVHEGLHPPHHPAVGAGERS